MRNDYNQTAANVLDILDDKKPQKVLVKPELTK